MTPKEKAIELVDKFLEFTNGWDARINAEECALIAVDELIEYIPKVGMYDESMKSPGYWQEVKNEIEKL